MTPISIGNRAYPSLLRSLYVKFLNDRCKEKAVYTNNQFQFLIHCNLDFWPFDPKIKSLWAHPGLIESLCVKFHAYRCKVGAFICLILFSVINALWPWPFDHLTTKLIRNIIDSWGVSMWSFMIIVRETNCGYKNIFSNKCIMTLTYDHLTQTSLAKGTSLTHGKFVCEVKCQYV